MRGGGGGWMGIVNWSETTTAELQTPVIISSYTQEVRTPIPLRLTPAYPIDERIIRSNYYSFTSLQRCAPDLNMGACGSTIRRQSDMQASCARKLLTDSFFGPICTQATAWTAVPLQHARVKRRLRAAITPDLHAICASKQKQQR